MRAPAVATDAAVRRSPNGWRRAAEAMNASSRRAAPPGLVGMFLPAFALAQGSRCPASPPTPGPGGSMTWSLPVQTLLALTALTFLPAVVPMR